MQDSEFRCLGFDLIEKQRFGDANICGGEMILIGQFFAVGSPGIWWQIIKIKLLCNCTVKTNTLQISCKEL